MPDLELDLFFDLNGHIPNARRNRLGVIISFLLRASRANAIGYALHRSRSHDAVIRVYDEAGNVIETHERKGDFKEW
jgi:hypothetical protein